MKLKMPKNVTIDKLAQMINRGFNILTRDNQEFRKEFHALSKRVDNLENSINTRLNKIEMRLDRLEQYVEELKLEIDQSAPYFEIKDLSNRVAKIEHKLGL